MVPPKIVARFLIGVASVLPKQKLVPQKDLAEAAFRDVKKRQQVCLVLNLLEQDALVFCENIILFFPIRSLCSFYQLERILLKFTIVEHVAFSF